MCASLRHLPDQSVNQTCCSCVYAHKRACEAHLDTSVNKGLHLGQDVILYRMELWKGHDTNCLQLCILFNCTWRVDSSSSYCLVQARLQSYQIKPTSVPHAVFYVFVFVCVQLCAYKGQSWVGSVGYIPHCFLSASRWVFPVPLRNNSCLRPSVNDSPPRTQLQCNTAQPCLQLIVL